MTRNEEKKLRKKKALMDSAYQLFTSIGYQKTTILFIATRAGVANGTFYRYFKDKEDIRDALIVQKSSELLQDAIDSLDVVHSALPPEEKLVAVTDFIITRLSKDIALLRFIAKNLSWGLFMKAGEYHAQDENIIDFQDFVTRTLMDDGIEMTQELQLTIFTILELISSTCYSVILDGEPVTLSEYKPFLYDTIRTLFRAKTEPAAKAAG